MKITRNHIFLLLTIILLTAFSSSAQTERDKGIELYKLGKYSEAVDILKQASKQKAFKNDGEVWNFLGLAYLGEGETKSGRKALEKAVKYAPQNSTIRSNLAYAYLLSQNNNKAQTEIQKAIQLDSKNAHAYYIRGVVNLREDNEERAIADAQTAIEINPQFTAAYILQSDGLLERFGKLWGETNVARENLNLLEQASESLNSCLARCPKDGLFKIVEDRRETVNAISDSFNRRIEFNDTRLALDNRTELKIISKTAPGYTDVARQNGEQGIVKLAVLFGLDGKVRYVLVLKGLNYGLTEKAVIAAKSLVFEPATENGKPVSVVKKVQFSFKIF